MLEQFKLKEQDTVRVAEGTLRETVTAIFEKMNVPPEDAAIAADVLVSADLRGVDTHGVSNLLRQYVERYRTGGINPRPKLAHYSGNGVYCQHRLGQRPWNHYDAKGNGHSHRQGQRNGCGHGYGWQRQAPRYGSLPRHAAFEARHDWCLHDQLPSLGGPDLWQHSPAGDPTQSP